MCVNVKNVNNVSTGDDLVQDKHVNTAILNIPILIQKNCLVFR